MNKPPSTDGNTPIEPSDGLYKANSIKEGFICAGIWVILAALSVSGIRLWGMYAHPDNSISFEAWAQLIGSAIGQFVLMAICLSFVAFDRRRKNVTSFVLLDWRWWLGLVVLSVVLQNPPLAWVWVGLVYQVRLSVKRKDTGENRKSSLHVSAFNSNRRRHEAKHQAGADQETLNLEGEKAMIKGENRILGIWRYVTIPLVSCFVLGGIMAGQDLPNSASHLMPQLPVATGVPTKTQLMPGFPGPSVHLQQVGGSGFLALRAARQETATTSGAVLRITLDEAQQRAAGASNPLVQLGEFQVEAARQHRLGVEALYFPNLGSQFDNLHFNKHPGQVFAVQGPLGNQHEVAVNIIDKDETVVNLSAVQPVTPLLAIHQLVKIARADENIARAKAGMPVAEIAGRVEKNYFDLLVAERELISAEAESKKIQGKWLTASAGSASISTAQEKDMISAEQLVVGPASKVKELTASLNELLGTPDGTKLELVAPEPLVENISLTEVTDKAMAANPEVIEAEQTAIKAHAANKISKMEYAPTVAIVGGYANQTAVSDLIFPRAAAYIGVVATYTVFDFGKREHGVKESKANAEAADLGVSLTKAKVAAAVKNSYFELERSRQFTQLARRMASATRVVEASYQPDDPEVESARAKVEADMFRSELEYRQALAKVRILMGER